MHEPKLIVPGLNHKFEHCYATLCFPERAHAANKEPDLEACLNDRANVSIYKEAATWFKHSQTMKLH